LSDAGRMRQLRKAIGAAGIGHFVEWFDFGLYGTLATVISLNFFQQGNAQAAILAAFAVFGAGFVMRPSSSARSATGSVARQSSRS
jgi:MHS family proline/betaine transporter-like MFS transporter